MQFMAEADLKDSIEFDCLFGGDLFLSEERKDQRIKDLETELEYELLGEQDPEQTGNLKNMFWESVLNQYENNDLIEAIIQNDISPSYDIDIQRGTIQSEICSYFPANFKKVQNSKNDDKVPNFRENEIKYAPLAIKQEYLSDSLTSLGNKYNNLFRDKLSKDIDLCQLVKDTVIKESYTELDNSKILPTSKKETKYLLGVTDNIHRSKNMAEETIQLICAIPVKESEKEQFINKRNIHALPSIEAPVSDKFEGTFEELIKMYEKDTNRQVVRVKTKKEGAGGKAPEAREFAIEDTTSRGLIDRYFEESPMILDYPFKLDDFQARAIYHLQKKESVFVAAHTSAGKTVVAEYAIALSRANKSKAIYTSPIKALSNQKYRDFQKKFGDVGIITGDVNLKPDASCLIMTTEILRNMLYRGNDTIKNIEWVIFDEIHYINNEERGVVWEESIIMLPDHIGIVMLSATVENVFDFAEWVGRITKKRIFVQKTDFRPVPLEHHLYFKEFVLLKEKDKPFTPQRLEGFVRSLKDQKKKRDQLRQEKKGELFAKKERLAGMNNQSERVRKITAKTSGKANLDYMIKKQIDRVMNEPKDRALPEVDDIRKLVQNLKEDNLLPAIFFVFSKKRLTNIVKELVAHVDLITSEERNEIEAFYYNSIKRLKAKDQSIYQLTWLKEIMMRGIGIHHGDLLPLGKEIVEILLQRNLIKLLFATDSFAMGLNMPTKTVIFNGLQKHDGTSFRDLLGVNSC